MLRLKPRKAVTAVLKRKDGYVLVYVLLVVILLGIFALTISSTALRNLKSQQNSIDQMQAQYEAEGQIELFWAKASELSESVKNGKAKEKDAIDNYINYLKAANTAETGKPYFTLEITQDEENQRLFSITVVGVSADKSAAVKAVISAKLNIIHSKNTDETQDFYMLETVELTYEDFGAIDPELIPPTQPTKEGGTP